MELTRTGGDCGRRERTAGPLDADEGADDVVVVADVVVGVAVAICRKL